MKTIVDISNVEFGFDNESLFSNLNLAIQQASWVGVIGPNGSGKTSLLNLILGVYQPVKGTIQLCCERKNIGYVPQLHPLNDDLPLSVIDVVFNGKFM